MDNIKYIYKEPTPKNYYGYLYEIDIHSGKEKHKYAGGKTGKCLKRKKYYGSVVTWEKEYNIDFYKFEVTITIIKYLTRCKRDVWRAENKYLVGVNAKDSLEYFNETNGGTKVNKKDEEVLDLLDKYKEVCRGKKVNGMEILEVSVEYLRTLDIFQPRKGRYISGHKKNISKNIDEFGNDYIKDILPVPAFKDFNGTGKHKRCGHSHVVEGIAESKRNKDTLDQVKLRLLLIDKKLYKHFTEVQRKEFCTGLNPKQIVITVPALDEDYEDIIVARYKGKDNIEIDSDANYEYLKQLGNHHGNSMNTIIRKAERLIEDQKLLQDDRKRNSWSEENELIEKKNDYISKHTTDTHMVLSFKSDQNRAIKHNLWDYITPVLNPGSKDEKTEKVKDMKYEILIEHPNTKSKKEWIKKQAEIETSFHYIADCIKSTMGVKLDLEFNLLKYDRYYTSTYDSINEVTI